MQYKYVPLSTRSCPKANGRPIDPSKWVSGPDPLTREKYYAWLKHRSQARYRKEEYHLTWQDWQSLWSDGDFLKRGRTSDSLCISRVSRLEAWQIDNCEVITRIAHLKKGRQLDG